MDILQNRYLDNTVGEWIVAGVIALVVLATLTIGQRLLTRRLRRLAQATPTAFDDVLAEMVAGTRRWIIVFAALYAGGRLLALPPVADRLLTSALLVALFVQAALWASGGIATWLAHHLREKRQTDAADVTTMNVLGFVARVGVWAVAALLILDNLGFNITALVASLGIGGVAVALALQNILGDVFASLSIALDKPFAIGDFIVVDGLLGTVERIGIKTTRLRSLSGEQLVFSNADLLRSRIHNYKRMAERRVVFRFGVVYQASSECLERIPGMVRRIVEAQPQTRFDRAHFWNFGDSSLDFEAVYYVLAADYNVYLDIQQAINLALFREFRQAGIEFAYPTRTVHVAGSQARFGGGVDKGLDAFP